MTRRQRMAVAVLVAAGLVAGTSRADIALLDGPATAVQTTVAAGTLVLPSFKVSAGAKVLVVTTSQKSDSKTNTVTWNGIALTCAVSRINGSTIYRQASIFYLFNPAPGTFNLTNVLSSSATYGSMSAFTLQGVDTTGILVAGTNSPGANTVNPLTNIVAGVAAGSAAVTMQANNTSIYSSGTPTATNLLQAGPGTVQALWMLTNTTADVISGSGLITGLAAGADGIIGTVLPTGGNQYYRNAFVTVVFAPSGASSIPAVSNGNATNVFATTAYLNGTLTSTGSAPTEVWVYWGTANMGTSKIWAFTNDFGNPNQPIGGLTYPAPSLSSNTTYWYTYYASNSFGDAWGTPTQAVFKTLGLPVVDNNGGASGIGSTVATLNGALRAGTTGQVQIAWGTVSGSLTTTNNFGMLGEVAFSTNLTGLARNTTYYYSCHASNICGDSWSEITNFTTLNITDIVWTNTTASGSWGAAAMWNTYPFSPAFDGSENAYLGSNSASTTTTLDGDRWVNRLTITKTNGSAYFYINPGTPATSKLVIKSGNITETNTWHVQIATTIQVDDGTNANPNALWTVNNNSYTFYVNNIAGLAGTMITKTGSPNLQISANNLATYFGNWSLVGGPVLVAANNALGAGSVSITNSASLTAAGNYVVSNNITLAGISIFGAPVSNVFTLAGNLTGNGAVWMGAYNNNGVVKVAGANNSASGDVSLNQNGGSGYYAGNLDLVSTWTNAGNVDLSTTASNYPGGGNSLQGNGYLGLGMNKKVYVKTIQTGHGTFIAPSDGTPLYPRADGNILLLTNGTPGTLTIGTPGNTNSVEFPSNSWLLANVNATTSSTLAVNGLLNLNFNYPSLSINGTPHLATTYTLAQYTSRSGKFTNVYFNGSAVANPETANAINGTHKLVYGATSLQLFSGNAGTLVILR